MLRLIGRVPNKFYVAVSGGVDSMVALDFFLNGRYKPTVIHFDHGTKFGAEAHKFIKKRCIELDLPLIVKNIGRTKEKGESEEAFWREERYKFFHSLPGTIITGHHLDDVVEWWIFSSLHGQGKIIKYRNQNVIRPFLATPKSEIVSWAERKNIKYVDDPSNKDERYMRSIIRHQIMKHALRVNPGIRKVIKKKIEKENANE